MSDIFNNVFIKICFCTVGSTLRKLMLFFIGQTILITWNFGTQKFYFMIQERSPYPVSFRYLWNLLSVCFSNVKSNLGLTGYRNQIYTKRFICIWKGIFKLQVRKRTVKMTLYFIITWIRKITLSEHE